MSAVAHDLRTPLATIYGFAKTIERGGGLDERQERFLGLIIAAAADMDRMIENVSTVGHIAEGRLSVDAGERSTRSRSRRPRWRRCPSAHDGRKVVLRPGVSARGRPPTSSVPPAPSRWSPRRRCGSSRAAPRPTAAPTAAPSAAARSPTQLLPGLEAHGRDVPVETARHRCSAHLGATLATEGDELVARF